MSEDQAGATGADVEWLPLPVVAERLGIQVGRVHQLLREHTLASACIDGHVQVPASFLTGDTVVKHLPGVLTVLYDGGFSEEEAIRWLHTPDDTLPGTPVDALRGDRSREVKRRAQALAL